MITARAGAIPPSLSARTIAQAHGARAVVWLDRDPAGFALWVHDAYNDRSVSRAAPSPPFSSSIAASLALSVKTTLMLVGVASEAPEQAPEPLATEKSAAIDAPPVSIATLELTPELEAPGPPPRWQLGAHGGVQLGPLEGGARDARYGLELRWFLAAPEGQGLCWSIDGAPSASPSPSGYRSIERGTIGLILDRSRPERACTAAPRSAQVSGHSPPIWNAVRAPLAMGRALAARSA